VGVPFYNNTDENQFKQSLYEVLEDWKLFNTVKYELNSENSKDNQNIWTI
jgi:hypothetical protein